MTQPAVSVRRSNRLGALCGLSLIGLLFGVSCDKDAAIEETMAPTDRLPDRPLYTWYPTDPTIPAPAPTGNTIPTDIYLREDGEWIARFTLPIPQIVTDIAAKYGNGIGGYQNGVIAYCGGIGEDARWCGASGEVHWWYVSDDTTIAVWQDGIGHKPQPWVGAVPTSIPAYRKVYAAVKWTVYDSTTTGTGYEEIWAGYSDTIPRPAPEQLQLQIEAGRDMIEPVFAPCFNAMAQEARNNPCDIAAGTGAAATRPDTTVLTIRATWQPSGTAAVKTVKLSSVPQPNSGGHSHDVSQRSGGRFFPPGADTDEFGPQPSPTFSFASSPTGVTQIPYRTTGVSGVETIIATIGESYEAAHRRAADSVNVTVIQSGLIGMARTGMHYLFTNQDPAVPSQRHGNFNNYLVPAMPPALEAVFAKYYQTYKSASKFQITDASLFWGGLHDVGSTAWRNPHKGHRAGLHADVWYGTVQSGRREEFRLMCTEFQLRCDPEPESNHWHIVYTGN